MADPAEKDPPADAVVDPPSDAVDPPAAVVDPPADPVDPPADGAPPPVDAGAKKPDWRDKRIAVLTAKLKEEEGKRITPAGVQTPAEIEAEIERRADERAAKKAPEIAAHKDYNRRIDEQVAEGRKEYGAEVFNASIGELKRLVIPGDASSKAAWDNLVSNMMEVGKLPKLIQTLGADLDAAERLMAMSPTRQALELAKLAGEAEVDPPALPKPITTIGSRGTTREKIEPDDPNRGTSLSTAEWMKRRTEQAKARGIQ